MLTFIDENKNEKKNKIEPEVEKFKLNCYYINFFIENKKPTEYNVLCEA
jgi:hypothetical protein